MKNITTSNILGSLLLCYAITGTNAAETNRPPTLREALGKHFLIGVALNDRQFTERDLQALEVITNHFNCISPENVLKWQSVHPYPDRYEFELADKFVEFGLKNKMVIIGHTLVWHHQTPRWVFQDDKGERISREALIQRMRDHIFTVVGRYKGKIKGWDVVNEALEEDGQLRRSPWLNIVGPDYIKLAFEFAHRADPGAELYYNDFSLENEPKRNGAIKLIKSLKEQGVPIHGIGLQGHYKMDWPSLQQIRDTINAFHELGLKVMITELDIDVLPKVEGYIGADIRTIRVNDPETWKKLNPYPDGLPADVEEALANRYAAIFEEFIKHKHAITRVTLWGVSDRDSWLNNIPIPGRRNYPLLFDRECKPKKAFYSVIETARKY